MATVKVFKGNQAPNQENIEAGQNPFPAISEQIVITNRDLNTLFKPLPYTLPATITQEGNITALYDLDMSSWIHLVCPPPGPTVRTIDFIFDCGREINIGGLILSGLTVIGSASGGVSVDISTSRDNNTYTSISSDSKAGIAGNYYFDLIGAQMITRFLRVRIVFTPSGATNHDVYLYFFNVFS